MLELSVLLIIGYILIVSVTVVWGLKYLLGRFMTKSVVDQLIVIIVGICAILISAISWFRTHSPATAFITITLAGALLKVFIDMRKEANNT